MLTKKPKCPVCKAETVHDMRPFCSKRCKDIDLARWLGDCYTIAGGSGNADEEGDTGITRHDGERDSSADTPDDGPKRR